MLDIAYTILLVLFKVIAIVYNVSLLITYSKTQKKVGKNYQIGAYLIVVTILMILI